MSRQIQQLHNSLNTIAKIIMNNQNNDISELQKAVDLISGETLEKDHKLHTMFSAVHKLTSNYLNKVIAGEVDKIEPANDGVLLLRAIVRSIISGKEFGFENKDIADVVENLKDIQARQDCTNTKKDMQKTGNEHNEIIKTSLEQIQTIIQSSSTLTNDDLPALGKILNNIQKIEACISGDSFNDFLIISIGVRGYIEKLILNEKTDTTLLTDSLYLLRAMLKSFSKGELFSFDIDEIVEKLEIKKTTNLAAIVKDNKKTIKTLEISQPIIELDKEDIEIIGDFIIEARENLDSIELNLIDIEQNPEDKEIINAIFRPFHTIKGVSGFLDMKKINALSHSTENLLDNARQGKFFIDHEITDLILKSVDILKQLLEKVEKGLEYGKTADDTDITINELIRHIEKTIETSQQNKDSAKHIGEILIAKGNIKENDISHALETQQQHPERKIGEILVANQNVKPEEVISALRAQKRSRKQAAPQVKVDTYKLDNLVDLTGELVIAQSMLRQNNNNASSQNQKILQNLNQLGQIVSNIQKIAMSMRMVPISATFQKMVRLVRDLSRNCKKEVYLEMSGEETEIDRNVVEALYEPMVHMIRNSIDHGLETEEERAASGKQSKGTIKLAAYHKGGNIVIEITDNGKGLNKFNILEKAIESDLVSNDIDLSDSEIFQLIMAPGFSTASEVTDISGRGVGMDVVKKAINDLRGKIDIQSEEGKGTTFTISLPLTLAIIDGMLVRVNQEKFIIPTMAILESFRPSKKDYFTLKQKGEMLMFRKNLIPIIRLNHICKVEMDSKHIWENIVVVVENKDEQRGILIDELLGKEEFVIKTLGESLAGIQGIAGGAILGDGKIGLIIDISGIFNLADSF